MANVLKLPNNIKIVPSCTNIIPFLLLDNLLGDHFLTTCIADKHAKMKLFGIHWSRNHETAWFLSWSFDLFKQFEITYQSRSWWTLSFVSQSLCMQVQSRPLRNLKGKKLTQQAESQCTPCILPKTCLIIDVFYLYFSILSVVNVGSLRFFFFGIS